MSPVQRKSPPVQVKEPYNNFDMVTWGLSSCNRECIKEGLDGGGLVSVFIINLPIIHLIKKFWLFIKIRPISH